MSLKSRPSSSRSGGLVLPLLSIVLVLTSFVLLLVTLLSAPNSSRLSLFTITGRRIGSSVPAGEPRNIRIDFGLFGYCQYHDASNEYRSYPNHCFRFSSIRDYNPFWVMRYMMRSNKGLDEIETRNWNDLTMGFALPAVAASMAGIAVLLMVVEVLLRRGTWWSSSSSSSSIDGEKRRRRTRVLRNFGLLFTALALVFSVAGLGCVFSLFQKLRKWIPGTISVRADLSTTARLIGSFRLSKRYGASAWTLVAAAGLLMMALGVTVFRLMKERKLRKRQGLGGVEKA